MNDTDKFIQEEYLPFYRRTIEAFKQNHQTFYSVLNTFLAGKKVQLGIRLTQNDSVIGEYTLYLEGVGVSHIDNGVLSPEVSTPFGVIKPYIIVEKSTVEKMIQDEPSFISDPFKTKLKYVHDVTIKFLK
jgi:hypothetical protein